MQNFSTVAQDVVRQYSQVGKIIIGAYRAGGGNLLDGTNQRYETVLARGSLPLVNDAVKAGLVSAQKRLAGVVAGSIKGTSSIAEQALDLIAGGLQSGIDRAAAGADRVQAALNLKALTTAGQLARPVAQLSLDIANRVVDGTQRIAEHVAGEKRAAAVVVKAAKRPAAKAVRRAKVQA